MGATESAGGAVVVKASLHWWQWFLFPLLLLMPLFLALGFVAALCVGAMIRGWQEAIAWLDRP